jgi:hypothetical protein
MTVKISVNSSRLARLGHATRFPEKLGSYDFTAAASGGGVYMPDMLITCALLEAQWIFDVQGDLAEIGVLEGRYLGLIHLFAQPEEHTFAIDPYDTLYGPDGFQRLDGDEIMARARHHVGQQVGMDDQLTFLRHYSTDIAPQDLLRQGSAGIRFFSLDGDHTENVVYSDLALAEAVLAPGGVVAMDDILDQFCPGVMIAYTRYMLDHPDSQMVPLIMGRNKLFLVKAGYEGAYLEFLKVFTNLMAQPAHPPAPMLGKEVVFLRPRALQFQQPAI